MFGIPSRRIALLLTLVSGVLASVAAGITVLARTVPRFNHFILLVPALKPFRYYPPEPPALEAARPLPPMEDRFRLAQRGIRLVEVSALTNSALVFESTQRPPLDQIGHPIPIDTREFTGLPVQELTALWDAQRLDCKAPRAMCFDPSYKLSFFNDQGAVLSVLLCWACHGASIILDRGGDKCLFDAKTPQATQLKQKLRALMPPLSSSIEWSLPPTAEGNADVQPPDPPLVFGPVTTSLPEAAALMQREVQKHQRQLAYCYERLRRGSSGINAQLIVEFDQAPYTPEMHRALVDRDSFASSERRYTAEPGCWNSELTRLGSRGLQDVKIVHSEMTDPILTACVMDSIRHWQICRRPVPGRAPLHTRVPILFRAPDLVYR